MKTGKLFGLVLALAMAAGVLLLVARRESARAGAAPAEPPRAFLPEALERTALVAADAEPLPAGRNVVWCASFQAAWDRLKKDVAGGPLVMDGDVAAALNASELPEDALPEKGFYAAAGRGSEILERIRREMKELFPNVAVDLPAGRVELAAYAYLSAGLRFDPPYFDARAPLAFRDGGGRMSAVNAFGVRAEDEYAYEALRQRVEIVFAKTERGEPPSEMVIDPCRTSNPLQILLALIPRPASLREGWEVVRRKLLPDGAPLGPNDTLLIPNVSVAIQEDFDVLTEGRFTSPALEGLKLDVARQAVEFRLNRGGAELGSEAKILALPVPTHYHFDRPFLIAMRKRGAARPFFLMWVDNAEVLK